MFISPGEDITDTRCTFRSALSEWDWVTYQVVVLLLMRMMMMLGERVAVSSGSLSRCHYYNPKAHITQLVIGSIMQSVRKCTCLNVTSQLIGYFLQRTAQDRIKNVFFTNMRKNAFYYTSLWTFSHDFVNEKTMSTVELVCSVSTCIMIVLDLNDPTRVGYRSVNGWIV